MVRTITNNEKLLINLSLYESIPDYEPFQEQSESRIVKFSYKDKCIWMAEHVFGIVTYDKVLSEFIGDQLFQMLQEIRSGRVTFKEHSPYRYADRIILLNKLKDMGIIRWKDSIQKPKFHASDNLVCCSITERGLLTDRDNCYVYWKSIVYRYLTDEFLHDDPVIVTYDNYC